MNLSQNTSFTLRLSILPGAMQSLYFNFKNFLQYEWDEKVIK